MRVLTITGNLGKDAEVKAIPSGTELCEFSVATSNKKSEETVWIKCVFCWDWKSSGSWRNLSNSQCRH